jgi:hypothetical protein
VEDVLSSFHQRTQDLRGEINAQIKYTLLDSQAVKKDLREELELWILETRIDIQATKTLVETTRRGLETRIAGLKARAEIESCMRTGTDVAATQPAKLDGSTSWAMFRREFVTVEEHNYWTPC